MMENLEIGEMKVVETKEVAKLLTSLVAYIIENTDDDYFACAEINECADNDRIVSFVGNVHKRIFVARDNNKIIGFIAGSIQDCFLPISSIKKVGYIDAAFVAENYRGHGVLKRLETEMTGFFKARGIKYAELDYIYSNVTAREAWSKMGYDGFRIRARKKLS